MESSIFWVNSFTLAFGRFVLFRVSNWLKAGFDVHVHVSVNSFLGEKHSFLFS